MIGLHRKIMGRQNQKLQLQIETLELDLVNSILFWFFKVGAVSPLHFLYQQSKVTTLGEIALIKAGLKHFVFPVQAQMGFLFYF